MENLSLPGNPRYQPREMKDVFGYDHLYKKVVEVELATLAELADMGVIPEEEYSEINQVILQKIREITTTEVDKVEREITHHDVRALVVLIQNIIQGRAKRWVHIPLTSYDPLDTARSLQFLQAYREVLKPSLKITVSLLTEIIEKHAGTLQIGRTHGQHALPITVGFWQASILNRMLDNWDIMEMMAHRLRGGNFWSCRRL